MSDKTPFQRAVDDLTGGDGCACHTGTGYNTACRHCQPQMYPAERSAGAAPTPADAVVGRGNPWQFFAEHPLPWEVSRTSAGVAIEDANNEVLWRFDHFDPATPEAFAKALNAVVSVEEVPYIRGYNVGWDDAGVERSAGAAPLDVERLTEALKVELNRTHLAGEYGELATAILARLAEGTDR